MDVINQNTSVFCQKQPSMADLSYPCCRSRTYIIDFINGLYTRHTKRLVLDMQIDVQNASLLIKNGKNYYYNCITNEFRVDFRQFCTVYPTKITELLVVKPQCNNFICTNLITTLYSHNMPITIQESLHINVPGLGELRLSLGPYHGLYQTSQIPTMQNDGSGYLLQIRG